MFSHVYFIIKIITFLDIYVFITNLKVPILIDWTMMNFSINYGFSDCLSDLYIYKKIIIKSDSKNDFFKGYFINF